MGRLWVLLFPVLLLPSEARALSTPASARNGPVESGPTTTPPAAKTAEGKGREEGKPAAPAAPAGDESEEEDPGSFSPSVEVGVSGSMGREANVEDHDWGPTLSVELACTPRHYPFVFGYGMEASYNDAETRLKTEENTSLTRTRFADIRYAKISFLRVFGFDVPRLGFTPYAATGVQYADQRSEEFVKNAPPTPDARTVSRDGYWSSTWGFGAEVPIGSRATLVLDIDQNTRGGLRYQRRLSLELKFRVLGEGQ